MMILASRFKASAKDKYFEWIVLWVQLLLYIYVYVANTYRVFPIFISGRMLR